MEITFDIGDNGVCIQGFEVPYYTIIAREPPRRSLTEEQRDRLRRVARSLCEHAISTDQYNVAAGEMISLLSIDNPSSVEQLAERGVRWTSNATEEGDDEILEGRYLTLYTGAEPIDLSTVRVMVPGTIEDPNREELAKNGLRLAFIAGIAARDARRALEAMMGLLWYNPLARIELEAFGVVFEEHPGMYTSFPSPFA